eukprot:10820132-Alexandrium_andersonii.AAC.1
MRHALHRIRICQRIGGPRVSEAAKSRSCELQSAILQSAIRANLGSWHARGQQEACLARRA